FRNGPVVSLRQRRGCAFLCLGLAGVWFLAVFLKSPGHLHFQRMCVCCVCVCVCVFVCCAWCVYISCDVRWFQWICWVSIMGCTGYSLISLVLWVSIMGCR